MQLFFCKSTATLQIRNATLFLYFCNWYQSQHFTYMPTKYMQHFYHQLQHQFFIPPKYTQHFYRLLQHSLFPMKIYATLSTPFLWPCFTTIINQHTIFINETLSPIITTLYTSFTISHLNKTTNPILRFHKYNDAK